MVNGYLTEEQRKHWDEQGYLIVKQVLSPEEVRTLLEAVDPVIEDYVRETDGPDAPQFGRGAFTIIRAIERTAALDVLTDHPNIFGTILALMGPLSPDYWERRSTLDILAMTLYWVSIRMLDPHYNRFTRTPKASRSNSRFSFS